MYPGQWHQVYGDKTGTSARAILPPLIERFGVRSLVEVGCGNAHWNVSVSELGGSTYTDTCTCRCQNYGDLRKNKKDKRSLLVSGIDTTKNKNWSREK